MEHRVKAITEKNVIRNDPSRWQTYLRSCPRDQTLQLRFNGGLSVGQQ